MADGGDECRVVFLDYPLDGVDISLTIFKAHHLRNWLTADDEPLRVRIEPYHRAPVVCVLLDDGLWRNGERFYV